MEKKDPLLASIKKTLFYAQIFNFPLTKKELYERLITPPSASFSSFSQKLTSYLQKGKIKKVQNYYFLPGKEETVKKRLSLQKKYLPKYQLAQIAAQFLAKIPEVSFVGLSGNLALGIAKPIEDLDLIIITTPNTLWLTRLKIYLLLKTKGQKQGLLVRKPQSKKINNRLCLNLFLDSADLKLKAKKQNLFSAYQIALIKPLLNKNQTFQYFLSANSWALNYLPHAFKLKKLTSPKRERANLLNQLAYLFQKIYMKKKQGKEKISLTQAFFHPRDKSAKILKKFRTQTQKNSS